MTSKPLNEERFDIRHISPSEAEIGEMLEIVKAASLDDLMDETIPPSIRLDKELNLPKARSEHRFIRDLRKLASKNKVFKSYIGLGYYDCIVPPVIQRNILENPGWYTAYTPYQSEIAQGRLEALVNFQTMVIDLTGLEIANSSLLDEGTAAAEAMSMSFNLRKGSQKNAVKYFVDKNVFPQTLGILKTRSQPLGIELVTGNVNEVDLTGKDYFGMLVQYPDNDGTIRDYTGKISEAHEAGITITMAADLLSLALLKPPGEMGADIAVGSTQRFGVPMGYGGPHAAYFATHEEYKRHIPGRIIGISINKEGKNGYRMALQTREQHIRRERATSNICTAQVLLAVMAGMYGVYHGPEGIRRIARKVHLLAGLIAEKLSGIGYSIRNKHFFDTLKIELPQEVETEVIRKIALSRGLNLRYFQSGEIGVALGETCGLEDVKELVEVFSEAAGQTIPDIDGTVPESRIPEALERTSKFMTHPVFNTYHSEHEMLRYLKRLENKDLSLVHSMISLGSCTMKLNATSEMLPVSWESFSHLHPFAPVDQAKGYMQLFRELEDWLSEITGLEAVSLQPNSGAQGEFSGLMVIRGYHESRGEEHRNITLIPSSAHGTNPASAVMAGTEVVIVQCDDRGNIMVDDLKEKAEEHKERLAALMVTYPSTHGVFEEKIHEICDIVHQNGGQVYMDGANMNAQVGLTTPARVGADVCHLNLHKTFCIPHGGGGPGMGPIAVASHLKPFLPGHPLIDTGGDTGITAISAAPWGSSAILPISHAYIAMMGVQGMKKASQVAILNANYIKCRLEDHYKVLYTGEHGRCAHEMIIDTREFREYHVEVEDIAKRLMDYGFHAPTVSFPVPGTMMIEPTESEAKGELDRFCDALIEIRKEIREVEEGKADPDNNVLKNAPHTSTMIASDEWEFPYTREKAAFPLPFVKENKFWPASSRIDNAYGDRNLVCSCLPVDAYEEEEATV